MTQTCSSQVFVEIHSNVYQNPQVTFQPKVHFFDKAKMSFYLNEGASTITVSNTEKITVTETQRKLNSRENQVKLFTSFICLNSIYVHYYIKAFHPPQAAVKLAAVPLREGKFVWLFSAPLH